MLKAASARWCWKSSLQVSHWNQSQPCWELSATTTLQSCLEFLSWREYFKSCQISIACCSTKLCSKNIYDRFVRKGFVFLCSPCNPEHQIETEVISRFEDEVWEYFKSSPKFSHLSFCQISIACCSTKLCSKNIYDRFVRKGSVFFCSACNSESK